MTAALAEAAAILRRDPRVAAASPLAEGGADGAALVVVPAAGWIAEQRENAPRARERLLRGWETVYDAAYRRDPAGGEQPDFNGWTSSFDGAPIPDGIMRDWLGATTALLREMLPNPPGGRVREIGCGNGLLVRALAPHCRSYAASDLSGAAVGRLQRWLGSRPGFDHVTLARGAAHAVPADAEPVDLVVLNSVAQYFPDRDYLEAVLARSWEELRPGGHLVVGDVRLLGLLPAFATAVEAARANGGDTAAVLRRRIAAARLAQGELLLDPAFFHGFARTRGGTVQVRLKPGRGRDEMTCYRCDVVLGRPPDAGAPAGPAAAPVAPVELADPAALERWLDGCRTGRAVLRGLGNARVARDVALCRLLEGAAPSVTVVELRRAAAEREAAAVAAAVAVDPGGLAARCAAAGVGCALLALPFRDDGGFDAWINGHDGAPDRERPGDAARPTASDPRLMRALRQLVAELHGELARALPAGDRPERIVLSPADADADAGVAPGWWCGHGWAC